jgi:TRAP transporter 4TM/12TM fusion protein
MSRKVAAWLTYAILVASSLVYLYTAGFGLFSTMTQRALHWTLMTVAVFLLRPRGSGGPGALGWLLAILAATSGTYALLIWPDRVMKIGAVPLADQVMAALAIMALLVALKRTVGWGLTITAGFFLGYAVWGYVFPGFLGHSGVQIPRLLSFLYMSTEGVFGIPLGISATYIIVFVIFGAFLNSLGGGQWFVDLAYALAGRFRGGPAKTAIVASGLMGMISGAPVANVATTGTFTIPLMKKVGYSAAAAGAIEAVASTGGMFLPPVMGAGAFIMAEYLNVSYLVVAGAAIVPATLYYFALLLTADARAAKRNLRGLPPAELPDLRETVFRRGHYAISLIFLIGAIVIGWSPLKAAFWSVVLSVVMALIVPGNRPSPRKLIDALYEGSKQAIPIAMACAGAGIIVGVLGVTGLGTKIASGLVGLSGGDVIVALLMTMVSAIILGAGMPVTAVYIILAATLVQPLTIMGIDPLAAHMFIFMFSAVAGLTPPVAITSYTAAGIANSDPNSTALMGFRFGLPGFIIPFMFVFAPALILQGSSGEVVLAVITACIGIACLVAALEGHLVLAWAWPARVLLSFAALLSLRPGLTTDLLGLALLGLAILLQLFLSRAGLVSRVDRLSGRGSATVKTEDAQ